MSSACGTYGHSSNPLAAASLQSSLPLTIGSQEFRQDAGSNEKPKPRKTLLSACVTLPCSRRFAARLHLQKAQKEAVPQLHPCWLNIQAERGKDVGC